MTDVYRTSEIRRRLDAIDDEIDYLDDILGHTTGQYPDMIAERENLKTRRSELFGIMKELSDSQKSKGKGDVQ